MTPRGWPSVPIVVAIVTPVTKLPAAARKTLGSMTGVEDATDGIGWADMSASFFVVAIPPEGQSWFGRSAVAMPFAMSATNLPTRTFSIKAAWAAASSGSNKLLVESAMAGEQNSTHLKVF
ncbi:hypothetical protein [Microvirga antarctica]|uniref:hypothetical protein n=1 Tax=Microvirga antarctica TaxID=2819233 RepID=UPI001B30E6F5|nr:hypothetical protein [Microvirga antarctica]